MESQQKCSRRRVVGGRRVTSLQSLAKCCKLWEFIVEFHLKLFRNSLSSNFRGNWRFRIDLAIRSKVVIWERMMTSCVCFIWKRMMHEARWWCVAFLPRTNELCCVSGDERKVFSFTSQIDIYCPRSSILPPTVPDLRYCRLLEYVPDFWPIFR